MHCLRWWLPLLLLPLPAAGPFTIVLFVVAYAITTKPCFYCALLLTVLLASTCSWYMPAEEPRPPPRTVCSAPWTPFETLIGAPAYMCRARRPAKPSTCWLPTNRLFASPLQSKTSRLVPPVSERIASAFNVKSQHANSGDSSLNHSSPESTSAKTASLAYRLAQRRRLWFGVGDRSRGLGYDLIFGWLPPPKQ
ncbi:BLADDER CANCER 10 KD PROTEIN HOMOLOG [Ceraceosorus bombacis]|uniref:BLADDER CANCER 10 KD PROTEIN HOMOLOG n=1 Tax=Ceraceosorus bombacis TaxID=401625 RepID=A0A0N7L9M9_9BASI|nr:BLADDER CANCER 10 KD PROTEIN HOMOLOG [Ceraceosorus bombacis]